MSRRARPKGRPQRPPRSRALLAALGAAALILALTADERVFGLGTDGRLMLRTAVSMVTLGEIGIASGLPVAVPREEGDAVSRYGMGASLVLAFPTFLAAGVERSLGVGVSQTLFVLHQLVLVLLAALSAGSLARAWGGDARSEVRAALATALASPLWAYVSLDFSEPLQAALAGGALSCAAHSVRDGATRRQAAALAAAAGFLCGFALLTKSLLVLLVPAVAAILFLGSRESRASRLVAAAAGGAPVAGLWLAFEIVRFGKPFGAYPERFDHPVLDGVWRLLVGPNKGLVFYFPLVALSVVGAVVLTRKRPAVVAPALGFFALLLGVVAAWWAWDGTFGWGPRLLLPAIPVLSALAALAPVPLVLFGTLFALGALVNGLAALQPSTLTTWTYKVLPRRELAAQEAMRWPAFTVETANDGRVFLYPQYDAANHAELAPIPLSARLLAARMSAGDVGARLEAALWKSDRPDVKPVSTLAEAIPARNLVFLKAPFRWPHLLMSLSRRKNETDWSLAYVEALLDQAHRAQDMGRTDRALDFGERVYGLLPNPQTAVVLAEGYRLAGRREALQEFSRSVLARRVVDPDFNLVLALAARDHGDTDRARALLEQAALTTQRPEVQRLLSLPPAGWPPTLRAILRAGERAAAPVG